MASVARLTFASDDLHTGDVVCAVIHQHLLITGGDDGLIKCWNKDELTCLATWHAHTYVVYDLAVDPRSGDIYSCSTDGEIKRWRLDSKDGKVTKEAQLIQTVIQTGPSGKGACLELIGENGCLQDTPVTVRKLLWRGEHLYSADELGSVCRWSRQLELTMKKEYLTEIWSLHVNEDESLMYTARDNDVIIASLPSSTTKEKENACVVVSGCMPGRAPVLANKDDSLTYSVSRTGLQVEVWKKDLDNREKVQKLEAHTMIVTCMALDGQDNLVTGGWDSIIHFWERDKSGQYSLTESIQVESYVNIILIDDDIEDDCKREKKGKVLVGGKCGYIASIEL